MAVFSEESSLSTNAGCTTMTWPARLRRTLSKHRYRAAPALGAGAAVVTLGAAMLPVWGAVPLALAVGGATWMMALAPARKSDRALRESERKFRTFVEQSLVGLYMVQDGRIVYANSKTAELLGYDSPDQLLGTPVDALTTPEDLPTLKENHRRRLTGEVPSIRYTYRALRRDGSRFWAEVHGGVCDYAGRPAIMGVALDVSQRVAFEQQSR